MRISGLCFLKGFEIPDHHAVVVDDVDELVPVEKLDVADRLKRLDATGIHDSSPEASELRSVAIPRQSVTVGGYLRAGEKETPRRSEAHKHPCWDLCALNTSARRVASHPGSKGLYLPRPL